MAYGAAGAATGRIGSFAARSLANMLQAKAISLNSAEKVIVSPRSLSR